MDTKEITPVSLSDTHEQIIEKVDQIISLTHEQLFNVYNADDLETVIKHIQHEALVDNVLYGDGFELQESKYISIRDERVDFDKIDVERYVKQSFKIDRETGVQTQVNTRMVRIVSGYSDAYALDELTFFTDVYDGDDKQTCIDVVGAKVRAYNALVAARDKHNRRKGDRALPKLLEAMSKAEDNFKIANGRYVELMSAMPTVMDHLSQLSKEIDSMNRLRHTELQNLWKNQVSTLRTAIKHQRVLDSQRSLRELRDKNKSLKTLWNKLTRE